jgi:hypothetical protein
MTLTPKLAHLRIRSHSERLERIVPRLAVGVGNVIAGTKPDADERQRPEDVPGVRRKGWSIDPTGENAIGKLLVIDGQLDDLDAHLATLGLAVSLIESFCDRWAPVSVEMRRCGQFSPSEVRQHPEFRGDCHNHAEADITATGVPAWRTMGVCVACRKRIERHDRSVAS